MKKCVLHPENNCTGCNLCNRCDLDPTKICDNCFRCLELDGQDYAEIPIAHVYTEVDETAFEASGEYYVPDLEHALQIATLHGTHGRRRFR